MISRWLTVPTFWYRLAIYFDLKVNELVKDSGDFIPLNVAFCLNLSFSKYNKHIYCEFHYVPVKTSRPSNSKSFKGLKGMFNQFWERLLEFSKCNFRIFVGSSFAHIQNHEPNHPPAKKNNETFSSRNLKKKHLGYKGKNHLNLPPPCILVPC